MSAADLMTPSEVAAALRVDPKTVSRWAKSGKIACFRLPNGRDRRYFREEIEAIRRGEPLTPEQVEALRKQIGGAS